MLRPIALCLALVACAPDLPDSLGDCDDVPATTWPDVEPIFAQHCVSCHASDLEPGERQGARLFVDFDTPEAARKDGFATWTQIVRGQMPPVGDGPSDDDARAIWAWLSCDGPD